VLPELSRSGVCRLVCTPPTYYPPPHLRIC
jgi:hypothetical protein